MRGADMARKKHDKPAAKKTPVKGAKRPYRKPDLVKHGVLSIVEGD